MTTTDASGSAPSRGTYKKLEVRYSKVDAGFFGVALFRPLSKQNRLAARRQMREIDVEFDCRKFRIVSPYTLGPDDLLILLAVCGLCGLSGEDISADDSEERIAIQDGLESEGEVVEATHIRLETTHYAILREAGLKDGGDAYARLNDSLERMSMVRYSYSGIKEDGLWNMRSGGSQNLLSAATNKTSGKTVIVLNARFTAALLGGQFIRIDLDEFRSLTDRARLLHMSLSVMIRKGNSLRIRIDDLADKIYGEPARDKRRRIDRRKYIRSGLKEIGNLSGWQCSETPSRHRIAVIERFRGNSQPS